MCSCEVVVRVETERAELAANTRAPQGPPRDARQSEMPEKDDSPQDQADKQVEELIVQNVMGAAMGFVESWVDPQPGFRMSSTPVSHPAEHFASIPEDALLERSRDC